MGGLCISVVGATATTATGTNYLMVHSTTSVYKKKATFYNDRVLYLAYFDSGYVFDRIQLECSYCMLLRHRQRI